MKALWAQSSDMARLHGSSSGGIFAALASVVLDSSGTVYGAAFTDDFSRVEHIRIDRLSELSRLMTSKYVQSHIYKEVYQNILTDLDYGRTVMFSGTACQVAAVKNFLGKRKFDGELLTVDVMCHGVPSPRLWSDYETYLSSSLGAPLEFVNFRSKTSGWKSFSLQCRACNEKEVDVSHGRDWYMKAFLTNHSLRASCLECPSKQSCGSDLTLGDYWGFEGGEGGPVVDKGVSAVVVRTPLGEKYLETVTPKVQLGVASYDDIASKNPALEYSVTPPEDRDDFLSDVSSGVSIETLMSRWTFKRSVLDKVKDKVTALLNGKGRSHD
ncbi:MAG: Coenzyme F420 hydrogenase/dehydrogenase, beta subunit C-terminal domain [Coriobacteriaceae bacterium]|nr:Coenzyme F420 hydrogenase/dehydrogenase, beta subunit C-terminal domain [Coriobacteriaceae bacterium]